MASIRYLFPILLCACAASVSAHPLAPSLLELRELDDGRVVMRFVTPAMKTRGTALKPVLPERCQPVGEPQQRLDGSTLALDAEFDCGPQGLVGAELAVSGLRETRTNVIVRASLAGGRQQGGVLHADHGLLVVRADPGALGTLASHLRLGFVHILRGLDHLLFVTGLLLLAGGPRTLLLTVSAFTLGHSLTLAAAALGYARLPDAPLEVAIALSLLWPAATLLEERSVKTAATLPGPGIMACGFGLLHGFGFAGVLSRVGLSSDEVPLALAGFNLGIELGQLVWVGALLTMLWALGLGFGRFAATDRRAFGAWRRPSWVDTTLAYALGSLAAFWVFERVAAAL